MTDQVQKISLQRLMIISAIVVASTGIIFGFALGRYQGIKSIGASPAEVKELKRKDVEHETLVDSLTDRINTTKLERDVALSALEEAKKLAALQQESLDDNAKLFETYRQVINARGGLALNVQQFRIKPLPENVFEYQLDLSQVRGGHFARGNVSITLEGNGQELIVPMTKADFAFAYTERMTGQWTMPANFTPQAVSIKITQGSDELNQRYAWQLGAVIPDMPDTLLEYQESKTLKKAAAVNTTQAAVEAGHVIGAAGAKTTTNTPVKQPSKVIKPEIAPNNKPENTGEEDLPQQKRRSTDERQKEVKTPKNNTTTDKKHGKEHQKNIDSALANKAQSKTTIPNTTKTDAVQPDDSDK